MAKYLGSKETEVIARLTYEKVTIITLVQFDKFFKFPPASRNNIIYRLKKKRILTPIKNGIYIFSPLEAGAAGRSINEFLIVPVLFPKNNYYVGYSTMYNYYGFTDQIFQAMYTLNTTIQGEKTINNARYKMLKISKDRMYGLSKIKIGDDEVIVSDKERTLVDMIYYPSSIGGLEQTFAILNNLVLKKKINVNKFTKYASLFPINKVRKRIGFILDSCGREIKKSGSLYRSVKGTADVTLYDTGSRKGKINKKWGIIENAAP